MKLFKAIGLVLRKDLRIERRTREISITAGFFSVLVTVLTSLSFYADPSQGFHMVAGVLWITLVFSGMLVFSRSWAREREADVFDGLWVTPLPRSAIYLGKTLGGVIWICVIEAVIIPLTGVFFSVNMFHRFDVLALLLLVGTVGFAAVGSLFSALALRSRMRDVLVSSLVFPLVAPLVLAGVVATREWLANHDVAQVQGWLLLMAGADLLLIGVCVVLFEPLMTD